MDSKKIRIIMAGPALDVKGGISSFAKNFLGSDLSKKIDIIYHPTTVDGNKFIKSFFFMKSLVIFIFRMLSDKRIRIVHILSASNGSFYRKAIILLIAKVFAKATIFHIHGGGFDLFYKRGHALKRFYIRKILNLSDTLLVLSRTWFSKIWGMTDNKNIRIIPNPIDTSGFEYMGIKRDSSQLNILTVGRLGKHKGTYDILDIIPHVIKEVPGARFHIAGDGDVEKVRSISRKKGIEENLILLGWLDRKRLLRVFKDSSIFLLPSYNEGFPVAMLEAMASGLPVVSTKVGGIPEMVEDGINGYLVNPGERQELCKRLVDLLKDRDLRAQMARNNTEKVDSMFRLDRVVGRFYAEYRSLAGL